MPEPMIWLPSVLLTAGLKVSQQTGWETRGIDRFGPPLGVMIHHTVGAREGNMPSLGTLTNGRAANTKTPALAGPLANLGLGRDGTFYVIAARLANHAGRGSWDGTKTGNTSFIGIECENTGTQDDMPWPDVQMDALRRGVAVLLRQIGATAQMCCGHREFALPHGRKIDPLFDMNAFRLDLTELMAGYGLVRPQIKAADSQGRPTLRRPIEGRTLPPGQLTQVGPLQGLLRLAPPSGVFDAATEAAVRQFQFSRGLVADGIVGPKTWQALDAAT